LIPFVEPARTEGALAAARELLPAWVVWGRSLLPAFVFLVQLCVAVGMVAWLERSAGPHGSLHWTERARRCANMRGLLQWPAHFAIGIALVISVCLSSPFDLLPGRTLPVATLAAYLLASDLGERWIRSRLMGQRSTWGRWCRQVATVTVLRRMPFLLAFACLVFVRSDPSPIGYLLLSLATLVILLRALGRTWELLRPFGWIREFDPQPGLGDPATGTRFFEVDLREANAFAYPLARTIVVTKSLRESLDPTELTAILQHELGHLQPARAMTMPFLGELGPLLWLAWLHPLAGWLGPAGAITPVLPVLLAKARSMRRSESNERNADQYALEHGVDPLVYASALEKLHRADMVPANWGEQLSHPDLYDRLLAAGTRPAFQRPAPTRPQGVIVLFLGPLFVITLAGVQRSSAPEVLDEPRALRAIALGGNATLPLASLAILHEQRGDRSGSEILRRAAQEAGAQR